jgi:hypothetical protein
MSAADFTLGVGTAINIRSGWVATQWTQATTIRHALKVKLSPKRKSNYCHSELRVLVSSRLLKPGCSKMLVVHAIGLRLHLALSSGVRQERE